jgi:hypothetical protein
MRTWKATWIILSLLCLDGISRAQAQQTEAGKPEACLVKRPKFDLLPDSGYGTRVASYPVPEGFPPFESRVRYIGNLRGSWKEMGIQYGRRAGDLINNVADYLLLVSLEAYGAPHLKEDLARYAKAIGDSRYPGVLTDFERIVLANVLAETIWMHPRPEFHHGKSSPIKDPEKLKKMLWIGEDKRDPTNIRAQAGCTGMILSGHADKSLMSATSDGETYLTQNMDAGYAPWTWNVAYVATPSDPAAHVYWSINTAGMVGANNTLVNWEGLGISHYYGGLSNDRVDFGVPFSPLLTYAGAYAKNVAEAIEILTVGTRDYQQRTGRKTVFRGGPWAFNIADPHSLAVIEISAHRYCVRRPGEADEKGNYTIYTNYYQCQHYYDEQNRLVNSPMGPPKDQEDEFVKIDDMRYYTVNWHIRHHFGQFDLERVRHAPAIRYAYDKETGRRIDFIIDKNGQEVPQWKLFSWSSESQGGGTMHTSVARLRPDGKSEIWATQGRPAEWIGEWEHFDFVGYGK